MSDKKPLFKSFIKYSFSSITTFFLFLLLVIAGRLLGAEDFGKFSFALAFTLLFEPLLDPGLYHLMIREVARNLKDGEKYLSHALAWKFIVAPIYFFIVYLIANSIHDSPSTLTAVYLIAISTLLKSSKDAFRSTLLAYEYFGLDTISLGIERLSLLVFGTLALVTGKGLLGLCWVFVLVRLLDIMIIFAIVRFKVCRVRLDFDFSFIKYILMAAIPIGAYYITLNVYSYVDTIMISMLRSDAEVGWYNASYKIYEGLMIVPVIIGTVFMPRLSQYFKEERENYSKLLFQGTKYVFLISLLIGANGIILSPKIIKVLFGPSYGPSIMALNILLGGIIFVFLLNFYQTAMITMDKQKTILYLAISGLILNIIINMALIPRFGFLGAAFATIFVEVLILIFLVVYFQKLVAKFDWWNLFGKPVLSILLPVGLILLVVPPHKVIYQFTIMNILFFISLYMLNYFQEEELRTILNIIPSRNRKTGRES